jgi:hypothetical protein
MTRLNTHLPCSSIAAALQPDQAVILKLRLAIATHPAVLVSDDGQIFSAQIAETDRCKPADRVVQQHKGTRRQLAPNIWLLYAHQ